MRKIDIGKYLSTFPNIKKRNIKQILKIFPCETHEDLLGAIEGSKLLKLSGFRPKRLSLKTALFPLEYGLGAAKILESAIQGTKIVNKYKFINAISRHEPVLEYIDIVCTLKENANIKYLQSRLRYVEASYLNDNILFVMIKGGVPAIIKVITNDIYETCYNDSYCNKDERQHSLLNISDIKSAFHVHTNTSDGNCSLEIMAKAAEALGFEYIIITDHFGNKPGYAGKNEWLKQKEEIKRLKDINVGIPIIHGAEVDVLPGGCIDCNENIIASADLIVIAIHEPIDATIDITNSLCRAMENPAVKVIAHPMGRHILSDNTYKVDIKALIKNAANNNVALEINGAPNKNDLGVVETILAKNEQVQLIYGCDAHSTKGLLNYILSMYIAMRAGLTKNDILNTKCYREFSTWMKA